MDTPSQSDQADPPLYLVHLSVHGLVRGTDLELGRDADTGGQVKYVIELAETLAQHPGVGQVDLLTRRVDDPNVDDSYAVPEEPLGDGARLVRIPCGPPRYIRKEQLWPYLDDFIDGAVDHILAQDRMPDLIHGHYADAGEVGARLAGLLGVPFYFTGHSLGRPKRRILEGRGMEAEEMEEYFNISRRIEAEETALSAATCIVASTTHEVEEQYGQYDQPINECTHVIPPGTDLSRFQPPTEGMATPPIAEELERFLREPDRPIVLALARPAERKNMAALVDAFGTHPTLRDEANLVLVAGNRDDLREMESGPGQVLRDLLIRIDAHDLHGVAAFPKHHESDDVPDLYRLAAKQRGVFVMSSLHEPFGLTVIEAAASGLPVVATNDGGPRDILATLENGLLVDPTDPEAIGEAVHRVVTADEEAWSTWSERGLRQVEEHYSWRAHARTYMEAVQATVAAHNTPSVYAREAAPVQASRLLICDIDNTLLGDRDALQELVERIRTQDQGLTFGIATGRVLESAVDVLEEWGVPRPDVLITAVGSEIHYGTTTIEQDTGWRDLIDHRWQPDAIREVLRGVDALQLQEDEVQRPHKISYYTDPDADTDVAAIRALLRQHGLPAHVIYSHGEFVDVLPMRASKGQAVRYLALRLGLSVEQVLVAGDSGNDEAMLRGATRGVVVGNHSSELEVLRDQPNVYFAEAHNARGILEGIEHFDFFTQTAPPAPAARNGAARTARNGATPAASIAA